MCAPEGTFLLVRHIEYSYLWPQDWQTDLYRVENKFNHVSRAENLYFSSPVLQPLKVYFIPEPDKHRTQFQPLETYSPTLYAMVPSLDLLKYIGYKFSLIP